MQDEIIKIIKDKEGNYDHHDLDCCMEAFDMVMEDDDLARGIETIQEYTYLDNFQILAVAKEFKRYQKELLEEQYA